LFRLPQQLLDLSAKQLAFDSVLHESGGMHLHQLNGFIKPMLRFLLLAGLVVQQC
jgi:hypothetical protein